MYDLTTFAQQDLDRCGEALGKLGTGATSMEEAFVRYQLVAHCGW